MDELISQISSNVGIDEATARKAVSIILSFLNSEGPTGKVQELISAVPGMESYISADAGGGSVMAVAGELQGIGLNMGEIQGVTKETVAFAKDKGGEDLLNEIVGSIPGLSQFV